VPLASAAFRTLSVATSLSEIVGAGAVRSTEYVWVSVAVAVLPAASEARIDAAMDVSALRSAPGTEILKLPEASTGPEKVLPFTSRLTMSPG